MIYTNTEEPIWGVNLGDESIENTYAILLRIFYSYCVKIVISKNIKHFFGSKEKIA